MSEAFYPSTFVLINGIKVKEIFEMGKNLTRNVRYYSNGNLMEEFFLQNKKINGEFRSFYNDGTLKESKQYKMGKLHGQTKIFNEDGSTKKTIWFSNDAPLNHDVNMKKRVWFNPYKTEVTYYANGSTKKISNFYKNKLHGKEEEFYENQQLKICRFYFHGKKTRVYREYYPSGNLRIRVKYNNRGEKTGKALQLFENNCVEEECFYENNLREGSRRIYFPSGNLKQLSFYKKGNLEGYFKKYTNDGKLLISLTYQNNMRHGVFQKMIYNDNGTITKIEGTFEHDKKNGVEITSCDDTVQKILRYNYGRIDGIQHSEMSVSDRTVFVRGGRTVSTKSSHDDICCVCYESTKFKTQCNHSLCQRCIIRVKIQCPMCRGNI